MTDGTATASPATVVTSASATPGATAAMLPEPPTAIPMNASITPSTVPSSPSSGLTEPNVASQGMKRADLPPVEEDEIPGDDGKHDEDGEDELGLAARREDQLPGRCGDRPAHLKEHAVSPPYFPYPCGCAWCHAHALARISSSVECR